MKKVFKYSVLLIAVIAISCKSNISSTDDTPTSGSISIITDETFAPIIQAEADVFQSIYPLANIHVIEKPEVETYNSLLKDSVKLIIASRPLTQEEKNFFNQKNFFPKEVKVAVDGVAVLLNNENKDTLLSMETLRKIFLGEITEWNQISGSNKLGKIKILFDNPNSSTVRYLIDSVCKGAKPNVELSAQQYNKQVVDYVNKTPNAIGFIGVNWVSDRDDTTAMSFLRKVKIAAISKEFVATYQNSYQPYQAYLATGKYPLYRYIYMISTDPKSGLASGFVSFVASNRGQRIILKSGLLPDTQPVYIREVQVTNEF